MAYALVASRMVQLMHNALEAITDQRTRLDLAIDLANVADQITDAECGLRRHLGLPEPE
jgi:hypothetical protein